MIGLLSDEGLEVVEASLCYRDFLGADEIFSTGNYAKVSAITRIDQRPLEPGPVFRRAQRALSRVRARHFSLLILWRQGRRPECHSGSGPA